MRTAGGLAHTGPGDLPSACPPVVGVVLERPAPGWEAPALHRSDRDAGHRGLLAGFVVDVHRPGTFVAIYLANALSFLAPLAVLLGPLRHASGKVERPPGEQDGAPIRTSYLDILRERAVAAVVALTFLSAFVGYAQFEAGFTALAVERRIPAQANGVKPPAAELILG